MKRVIALMVVLAGCGHEDPVARLERGEDLLMDPADGVYIVGCSEGQAEAKIVFPYLGEEDLWSGRSFCKSTGEAPTEIDIDRSGSAVNASCDGCEDVIFVFNPPLTN